MLRQLNDLNACLRELESERNELHDRLEIVLALQDALREIAGALDPDLVVVRTINCTRDVLGFSRAIYLSSDDGDVVAHAAAESAASSSEADDPSRGALETSFSTLAIGGGPFHVGGATDLDAPMIDTRGWFVVASLGGDAHHLGFLYADGHRRSEPKQWETELVRTLAAVAGVALASALSLRRASALAMRDSLTGLLNRRAFEERTVQELESCRRYDRSFTLVMADLDDFKRINDSLGHLRGDAVLKSVALALKEATRAEDVVGRFAGDEFVALLVNTDREVARQMVARLSAQLIERRLQCSLGAAIFPWDAPDLEGMLKAADAALYAAKRAGKNGYAFAGVAAG